MAMRRYSNCCSWAGERPPVWQEANATATASREKKREIRDMCGASLKRDRQGANGKRKPLASSNHAGNVRTVPDTPLSSPPVASDPNPACCGRCGAPDASRFGDELICDDCYVDCGACCADDPDDD